MSAPQTVTDAEIEAVYMQDRNAAARQFFAWQTTGILTPAQLRAWLLEFWGMAEWPREAAEDAGLQDAEIVAMFRAAGFVSDDPETLPPDAPIELYRGCTEYGTEGFSWTTDPETARWFARREAMLQHDPEEYGPPVIVAATIAPEHILATITGGRGETEAIIDPIGALEAIGQGVHLHDLDTPDIPAAVATYRRRREEPRP